MFEESLHCKEQRRKQINKKKELGWNRGKAGSRIKLTVICIFRERRNTWHWLERTVYCKNTNLENKKEFLHIKNVIAENRAKLLIYCDWKSIDNVKIYDNRWRCPLSMLFGNMQQISKSQLHKNQIVLTGSPWTAEVGVRDQWGWGLIFYYTLT